MGEPEHDPLLRLVDAVLIDLAVRSAMYVARRREDGDRDTFVIQTGEEGRFRLSLPDLDSDTSVEATVAEAQAHLGRVLDAPVPLCPLHQHALVGAVANGMLTWVCPNGEWECALGDYEELTWPQLDVRSLAPILSRRLQRRGTFPAVRSIGVTECGEQRVADFGLVEANDALLQVLAEVAAPLPMTAHESPNVMLRPLSVPLDRRASNSQPEQLHAFGSRWWCDVVAHRRPTQGRESSWSTEGRGGLDSPR
jgi:hypothetical protein